MAELVGKVLRDTGLDGRETQLDRLRAAWPEAVGKQAAEQSHVESFKGGRLTVEVASAALAQELGVYLKARLLQGLRERTRLPVQDLRVKLGGRGKARAGS